MRMSGVGRIARSLRRTAIQAVPTVFGIIIINFFLMQLAPGDVADVLAGESGAATEENMRALREQFGLHHPVMVQLYNYLGQLANFSLGFSARYGMPVADLIAQRLPGTLLLMSLALGIALLIGVVLGSIMAIFAGRLPDRVLSVLALVFYSVPGFWIGLMLIILFSVQLGWLPSGGAGTIGANLSGWAGLWDKIRYMILPATSLALFYVAIYARLTRASMLEVKSQDFVRTARAKGLTPFVITSRHVLRNALIPIVTLAGMHFGSMLGGAVVVETVYSWPGLGRLAYEAVMGRDFTVLLGILLLSSFLVIAVNALVDILQTLLDPRIGVR